MAHTNSNVFARIREELSEQNGEKISLRKMEQLLGGRVAHSHIIELEKGKTQPSLSQLRAYHECLNIPYDTLLGDNTERRLLDKDIADTLKYIKDSEQLNDRNINRLIDELLTSDRGYALLFYLSEYLYDDEYIHSIGEIISTLRECEDLDYSEIRTLIDNKVSKE